MKSPFAKETVRASAAPSPVQVAARAWDDRLGSTVTERNAWRIVAIGALCIAAAAVGYHIYRGETSEVVPYIVALDDRGIPLRIAEAEEPYKPGEAMIASVLGRWVQDIRGLSLDPIVIKTQWLNAYNFLTPKASMALNEWAKENNPIEAAKIGQKTVTVEIVSVTRPSKDSYQVRWIEKSYANGSLVSTQRWVGLFTIAIEQPRTITRLRVNPLGVYITNISWTQEQV